MLNYKIISNILGTLLFIEAAMMTWCMTMALFMDEDDSIAFIISVILTILGGIVFKYLGRNSDNSLGRREAYLLVTLTWIIFSLFGSFPFIISGYITNFTDAYFETISGFTTTGCSILDDVESLPHGILFWRTMTQWIGGLGIVFLRKREGLLGGGDRSHPCQDAPPTKYDRQMDLEHLPVSYGCLLHLLLSGGDGSLRQLQLCHDNNGYGRLLHP